MFGSFSFLEHLPDLWNPTVLHIHTMEEGKLAVVVVVETCKSKSFSDMSHTI